MQLYLTIGLIVELIIMTERLLLGKLSFVSTEELSKVTTGAKFMILAMMVLSMVIDVAIWPITCISEVFNYLHKI